jgi:hypothetical protein
MWRRVRDRLHPQPCSRSHRCVETGATFRRITEGSRTLSCRSGSPAISNWLRIPRNSDSAALVWELNVPTMPAAPLQLTFPFSKTGGVSSPLQIVRNRNLVLPTTGNVLIHIERSQIGIAHCRSDAKRSRAKKNDRPVSFATDECGYALRRKSEARTEPDGPVARAPSLLAPRAGPPTDWACLALKPGPSDGFILTRPIGDVKCSVSAGKGC